MFGTLWKAEKTFKWTEIAHMASIYCILYENDQEKALNCPEKKFKPYKNAFKPQFF